MQQIVFHSHLAEPMDRLVFETRLPFKGERVKCGLLFPDTGEK